MSSIFDNLESHASNIAFQQTNNPDFSYSDLIALSLKILSKLASEEIIIIQCSSSIEPIACYVGCLRHRVVPILLDDQVSVENLQSFSDLYKARYIFTQTNKPPEGYKKILQILDYFIFENSKYSLKGLIHSELALLITTSGSTGNPKLVKISHNNLISNTESIIKYLSINPQDKPVTVLPMNYTFGLSVLNTHLYAGATIVLNNVSILEKNFWQTFEKFHPTSISGVPYTFQMLERLNFFSRDLQNISKVTQAGGKLSKDMVLSIGKQCEEQNIQFYVMYGQSEATARMSYLPPEYTLTKPSSVGIAIPGGAFWLEDDHGNKIHAANTSGNLIYSGYNVSMGYANSWEDLSSGDKNMNVLETGDLAKIDDDGFVYIVGRQKRFIKIFGNRINLDDIENFFAQININAAAVGSDDHLVLRIEGTEGAQDLLALKKSVSRFIKVHPSSIKISYIDALPRNASGKLQYNDLAK